MQRQVIQHELGSSTRLLEPQDISNAQFCLFMVCPLCPPMPTAKQSAIAKFIAHNWQWHIEGCPCLPAETTQQEKQ